MRRAARARGVWAERAAVVWLWLHGYHLLDRGHLGARGTGTGEVDIIARRGDVVAFVEVKLRPSLDQAAAAISPRQQRRIANAARAFLSGRPDLASCTFRFDAVLVAPWRLPCHLRDAWRVDGVGRLEGLGRLDA
jgi:putative endonuclease